MRAKMACAIIIMTLLSPTIQVAAESEVVALFNATAAETRPGDAVMIKGDGLDKVLRVEISRLEDEDVRASIPQYVPQPVEDRAIDANGTQLVTEGVFNEQTATEVELLQRHSSSLKFVVPKTELVGVYSVRLTHNSGGFSYVYLNAPKARWAISEEGLRITIGDYLRIQGRNLKRNGNEQVVLVGENGNVALRTTPDKLFDDYSVQIQIPTDLPAGNYDLYYHNGMGGVSAWSEPLKLVAASKSEVWWGKQFNVKEFGAKGDAKNNDTAAFREALNAAEENGGGTVYIPRGKYMLTGELIMPPYTVLKGESKQLTQLFWNPLGWDIGELPTSLIIGSHHFSVTDLNIWASRASGVIVSTGEEMGNITLENLVVRQNFHLSGLMAQNESNRSKIAAEHRLNWSRSGISLEGENIKIRNSDFNSNGMYQFLGVSGFIQNCNFTKNQTGADSETYWHIRPNGMIVEDTIRIPGGYGGSITESNKLYEARVSVNYSYANDREPLTLDGGSGAYYDKILSVSGDTIVLAKNGDWTENKWIGGGVYIMDGTGQGQFRRIKSHTMDTVVVDTPFVVQPDLSSVLSITTVRQDLYFINNSITDSGAYQLYGSSQNVVFDGIKFLRCGGLRSMGMYVYSGRQPNWYIDVLNCEFREGNYSHWFGTADNSGQQFIQMSGRGATGLSIGTLVRRNKLYDLSFIQLSTGAQKDSLVDSIVDDNTITTAEVGIHVSGFLTTMKRVFLHNNHFDDVSTPILVEGANPDEVLIIDYELE